MSQLIHLLYAPTEHCNLGCRYCYLGSQTDAITRKQDFPQLQQTLVDAVAKFQAAGVTPFNISLHGGEVTTLPGPVLAGLFEFIRDYYAKQRELLKTFGLEKTVPHIKTNLFNFDKHYPLLDQHQVSISASVDLPLSLHEQFRVNKQGHSTLAKTLANVRLLAQYPHRKKLSSVLYQAHLAQTEQIIDDIWYLHREIGFDMNQFNFMFGFESAFNQQKFTDSDFRAVDDQMQVAFYQRLKQAFKAYPYTQLCNPLKDLAYSKPLTK